MKDWEIVKELIAEGFEVWFEDDRKVVLGKVLYQDGHGNLQDWEEVIVDKRTGEWKRRYGTNRSVPGWEMDPETGEWHKEVKA